MREGLKNWLIVFAIVIVSALIIDFGLFNKQNDSSQTEILGVQEVNYKYVPYITSISTMSVTVGDEFEYIITSSDLDTPEMELEYSLKEKPDWMYIEGNRVYGVPLEVGTYKFVVSVSDGVNSTSQINYILVEDEK